ncbi:MAG: glutamyl-tRNA reductase [candidate division Zixibacteria bacterium]|nr:glutamyl-tRNA reductase [candidate division Zixibacteria bacterium]
MRNVVRVVGTSISHGNMPLLEKLTIPVEDRAKELPALKNALGVEEILYLATCNRVEIVVACSPETTAATLRNKLLDFFLSNGRQFHFSPADLTEYSYSSAIRHEFRVVSALESIVVGETQITGQFKAAARVCDELGFLGETLKPLVSEALQVAKRVRNETELGSGALSMASLVVLELERIGALSKDATVAIIGRGEISSKMANHLKARGVGNLVFVNRTFEKAEMLAKRFDGRAISLADFLENPCALEIIMSATNSSDPIFTASFLDKVSKLNERLVCVDLAIPRDFSAEYRSCEQVTMIDIPQLNRQKDVNLKRKFREIDKAEEIVDRSVREFLSAQIESSLRPALRRSFQESLDFALESYENLLLTRLTDQSPETAAQIKSLIKKVVGYSSSKFSQAVSAHLSKDYEYVQRLEIREPPRHAYSDAVEIPETPALKKVTRGA